MRLIYALLARQDLSAIHAYIAYDSRASADRMLLRLTDACEDLLAFPDQGRPGIKPGTRELVTVAPYIIIYRALDDSLEIVRIHHAAQDR